MSIDTFGLSCQEVYTRVYMEGQGLRVLRGLCDELFGKISMECPYTISMTSEDRWSFGWSMYVRGLGFVSFNWRAPKDGGREWLKRKDEKFREAYREMVNSELVYRDHEDKENLDVGYRKYERVVADE